MKFKFKFRITNDSDHRSEAGEEKSKRRIVEKIRRLWQLDMRAVHLAPISSQIVAVSRCSLLHSLFQETIIQTFISSPRIFFVLLRRERHGVVSESNFDRGRVASTHETAPKTTSHLPSQHFGTDGNSKMARRGSLFC